MVLRDDKGVEITRGPTVADLAAAGEDWALDFPGDALSPGCTYEQWEASFGADPVVYGRVVRDRGKVIAQYWMFYIYNDWNDRHESDWEMIQLVFDAPTVAEAMAKGPALYAYAQHEGSQYVMPNDVEGLDVSSTGDDVHLVGELAGRVLRAGIARLVLQAGQLLRQERGHRLRLRRHHVTGRPGQPVGRRAPRRATDGR